MRLLGSATSSTSADAMPGVQPVREIICIHLLLAGFPPCFDRFDEDVVNTHRRIGDNFCSCFHVNRTSVLRTAAEAKRNEEINYKKRQEAKDYHIKCTLDNKHKPEACPIRVSFTLYDWNKDFKLTGGRAARRRERARAQVVISGAWTSLKSMTAPSDPCDPELCPMSQEVPWASQGRLSELRSKPFETPRVRRGPPIAET